MVLRTTFSWDSRSGLLHPKSDLLRGVCNYPAIGCKDHPTYTTLYDDDPRAEEIEGILLNCSDEILERAMYKPPVDSAPGAEEIPANILRLALVNPVGHDLIKTPDSWLDRARPVPRYLKTCCHPPYPQRERRIQALRAPISTQQDRRENHHMVSSTRNRSLSWTIRLRFPA